MYKENPVTYLKPSQLINPAIVEGASPIDSLVSNQRRKAKELFILCKENTSSLTTVLFLAFQTVQKRQSELEKTLLAGHHI